MKPMPEHRCPAEWPGRGLPTAVRRVLDDLRCDLINGHQGGHQHDAGFAVYVWGTGQ